MIALIPSLSDCKLRELEFLTFLLSRSSLNNFAFSTTLINLENILTVSCLSSVVASCIEEISIELIFKQLCDWVTSVNLVSLLSSPTLVFFFTLLESLLLDK